MRVRVTEVSNPDNIPLAFTIHWQTRMDEPIYLGTFSLYPPDNPGTFLVATRGKVQTGGELLIRLVPLQQVGEAARLSVHLSRLELVDQ